MAFRTIIETGELAAHLNEREWRVVDCRFDLRQTSWGEETYATAHIPGAVYAHLDRDLSGAKTGSNGRHPLPDADRLAHAFGRLGIGPTTQVVAYDQDLGSYASRLWWLLRWLGHDAVAVLNGGFAKWVGEGRHVAPGVEAFGPQRFVAHPRAEMVASTDDVAAHVARSDWRVVDARSPDRFRGENETIDKVPGRIPGAVNRFFQSNLTDGAVLLSVGDLQAGFHDVLGGVPASHTICYCGSGVTACQNLLAMEHAGLHGARLYAGSWSEWSADPSRPVATGDD